MKVRLATRRSPLAIKQAEWVRAALLDANSDLEVELCPISTRGDELLDRSLVELGGKGLFIKALEVELIEGRADIAVNSLKDMPAVLEAGFLIGAIPQRADPRDSLVSRYDGGLDSLPINATVGSASPRRTAQILALRPDLRCKVVRGSVETRLRKLDAGEFDALVLAAAGLERLGINRGWTIDPKLMLPAAGQGALALEVREDNLAICQLVDALDDPLARICVTAERACSEALGTSCVSPFAVFATVDQLGLHLQALVARGDGRMVIRAHGDGNQDHPRELGENLARDLLDQGASEILTRPEDVA